ncbi:MAG: ABC transporter permease [Oscillospiraceae bacterium]|nr:ABC transporter permease [Oscillospiraceae bacterium]
MVTKSLWKNIYRDIFSSVSRFLAIVIITALGAFVFCGLRATAPDMENTADKYYKDSALMDYRLLSSVGFDEADVEALRELPLTEYVKPAYRADVLVSAPSGGGAVRLHAIASDAEEKSINDLIFIAGRGIENDGECLIGSATFREEIAANIGDIITITDENKSETLDMLATREFTVVGIVQSPLYITNFLGGTDIGSGSLLNYMYVGESAFDISVYTELFVVAADKGELSSFSDEYKDLIGGGVTALEDFAETRAQIWYDRVYNDALAELTDAENTLSEEREKAYSELADAKQKLDDGEQEIADGKAELEANALELEAARIKIADGQRAINDAENKLAQYEMLLTPEQLTEAQTELAAQKTALNTARKQYTDGLTAIDEGWKKIEDSEQEIADGRAKYETGLRDADIEFAKAENEIADGYAELAEVKVPTWYVYDRKSNPGYDGFGSDAGRINALALTIPVFFFLVSALVCLTTMTRMVEEQRTQIGVIKALGFRRGQIMFKFMLYATAASVTGAIIGIAAGILVFPVTIWDAYKIMYRLPAVELGGNVWIIVNTFAAAVLSTVIPTYIACRGNLREMSAALMRPKAPKIGARVLLERITFIWRRLKFSHKVTARNIFLNKSRLFMTLIGVMGCTALLLTGFGLRNSITGVAVRQFDAINLQDAEVTLRDASTGFDDSELNETLAGLDCSALYYRKIQIDAVSDKVTSTTLEINLMIPEDLDSVSKFIRFNNVRSNEELTLKPGSVIITEKLAEWLKISVGDTVTISTIRTDGGNRKASLTVAGISENYVGHIIYISPETYERELGDAPEYDGVLLKFNGDFERENILTSILTVDNVLSALDISVFRSTVADMLKSMDTLVWIIIGSATALAFVVLYNLTNINITERIRELATLKVLGFYEVEVRRYVYRESRVLTVFGMLLGLVGGIFLTQYVIVTAEVDNIMFLRGAITPLSYGLSVVITLVSAEIVHWVMRRGLTRINMVDSLKSAE